MSFRKTREDREYDKFIEIGGDTFVKVTGSNFTGEFTPGGLKNNGKIQKIELTNTEWRPVPATAYIHSNGSPRAFVGIQNRSGQDIAIYFPDDSGTPPDNSTILFDDGWIVQNLGEIGYDVSAGVVIYARSKTSTCFVKVKELA